MNWRNRRRRPRPGFLPRHHGDDNGALPGTDPVELAARRSYVLNEGPVPPQRTRRAPPIGLRSPRQGGWRARLNAGAMGGLMPTLGAGSGQESVSPVFDSSPSAAPQQRRARFRLGRARRASADRAAQGAVGEDRPCSTSLTRAIAMGDRAAWIPHLVDQACASPSPARRVQLRGMRKSRLPPRRLPRSQANH